MKMDTIFMNSKNSKTSKLHVLILKFNDKLDLRKEVKIELLYQIFIFIAHRKI